MCYLRSGLVAEKLSCHCYEVNRGTWTRGKTVKKIEGFDVAAYQERLRLLREIISGENQADFARRLGIPTKRWSNYERGYPVPRETAWALKDRFKVSVEWIWWGWEANMPPALLAKVKAAQKHEKELTALRREASEATKKLREAMDRRKKAIGLREPAR
jgi:DNA-binding XRE family transcriptional regulator